MADNLSIGVRLGCAIYEQHDSKMFLELLRDKMTFCASFHPTIDILDVTPLMSKNVKKMFSKKSKSLHNFGIEFATSLSEFSLHFDL